MDSLKRFGNDKPLTAITQLVNRACTPIGQEDGPKASAGAGINWDDVADLVDVVGQQAVPGAQEALRAIRKNVKHSLNARTRVRSILVLSAMADNCDQRFRHTLAHDDLLLDYLRGIPRDTTSPEPLKRAVIGLLKGWKVTFASEVSLQPLAMLYDGTSHARAVENAKADAEQRKREEEARAARDKAVADKLAAKEAKRKAKDDARAARQNSGQPRQRFDFEKAKPDISRTVADATRHVNSLVNSLQHIPSGSTTASIESSPEIAKHLAAVKQTRKAIVRYVQLISSDADPNGEYIGVLLSTNEQVLAALQLYDRIAAGDTEGADETADQIATATEGAGAAAGTSLEGAGDGTTGLEEAFGRAVNVNGGSRRGEIDRLQARQVAEVKRLNQSRSNPNSNPDVFSDLQGLAFGSIGHSSASNALQAPMQPRPATVGPTEALEPGTLSDYSDYDSDSSEGSPAQRHGHGAASGSGSGGGAGEGNRAYEQYLSRDDAARTGKGLLNDDEDEYGAPEEDPFADPFADPQSAAPTPSVHTEKRRMGWAEV